MSFTIYTKAIKKEIKIYLKENIVVVYSYNKNYLCLRS